MFRNGIVAVILAVSLISAANAFFMDADACLKPNATLLAAVCLNRDAGKFCWPCGPAATYVVCTGPVNDNKSPQSLGGVGGPGPNTRGKLATCAKGKFYDYNSRKCVAKGTKGAVACPNFQCPSEEIIHVDPSNIPFVLLAQNGLEGPLATISFATMTGGNTTIYLPVVDKFKIISSYVGDCMMGLTVDVNVLPSTGAAPITKKVHWDYKAPNAVLPPFIRAPITMHVGDSLFFYWTVNPRNVDIYRPALYDKQILPYLPQPVYQCPTCIQEQDIVAHPVCPEYIETWVPLGPQDGKSYNFTATKVEEFGVACALPTACRGGMYLNINVTEAPAGHTPYTYSVYWGNFFTYPDMNIYIGDTISLYWQYEWHYAIKTTALPKYVY